MQKLRHGTTLAVLMVAAAGASAQDHAFDVDPPSTKGVMIALKAGLVLASPRQPFPSIRIGDSFQATGEISSSNGSGRAAYRYGLDVLFPFNRKLALATEFAIHLASVEFQSAGRPALRFQVQSFNFAFGLQGNIYLDSLAFLRSGLRTVYLGGGLDIAPAVTGTRVEGYVLDSAGNASPAVGSFDNNEPFRTLVALRFAGGGRFGFGDHMEMLTELSYAFALNPLFSGASLRDNSFTLDHFGIMAGIGYRF